MLAYRQALPVVVAGVALSGCGRTRQLARPAVAPAVADAPMLLRLLPPAPELNAPLRFVLNQPAYVAVFDVYPGAGVRLLYPEGAREELQHPGLHQRSLITSSFDADLLEAIFRPTGYSPHYLYAIASREPLGIARYVHRPLRLASRITFRQYYAFDPAVAMDALLNRVVSLGSSGSWDADVYMVWDASHADGVQTVRVVCTSGWTMLLPAGYPFAGCPGDPKVVYLRPDGPSRAEQRLAIAARAAVRADAPMLARSASRAGTPSGPAPVRDVHSGGAVARSAVASPAAGVTKPTSQAVTALHRTTGAGVATPVAQGPHLMHGNPGTSTRPVDPLPAAAPVAAPAPRPTASSPREPASAAPVASPRGRTALPAPSPGH